MSSSEDDLSLEQKELNKLLHESETQETTESKVKTKVGKHVSNDNLIDFDPLNNGLNTKQDWYFVSLTIIVLIAMTGVALNVVAWNKSRQNHELLDSYQEAFKNYSAVKWLTCYNASDPRNPCNAGSSSPDSLYNWQTGENYRDDSQQYFPCLEIDRKFIIFPNFSDTSRIDFSDAQHMFSLSSLVFPNTDTISNNNNQVKNSPYWQQSTIRTVPGTRFIMAPKTNLNVNRDNMFAIQLPVISNQGSFSSDVPRDYCQTAQFSDIVDNYPLFMYYNPNFVSNGSIPFFSVCTCLQGPIDNMTNPFLWNTMCVDASTFTLTP